MPHRCGGSDGPFSTVIDRCSLTMTRGFVHLPVHVARHVSLRVITPDDYGMVYSAETGPFLGDRWRHRSRVPSYEEFAGTFFNGVLAQYLIVQNTDGLPLGYVTLYDAHFEHGFAYIAATRFDDSDRTGRTLEGVLVMLDLAFERWPLRRVYAVSSAYSASAFQRGVGSGVGRLLTEVSRLPSHEYWKGRYWDQITYMLSREDWMEQRDFYSPVLGEARWRHCAAT